MPTIRALPVAEQSLNSNREEIEASEPEPCRHEKAENRSDHFVESDADSRRADPDRDERLTQRDDQHETVALGDGSISRP